MRMEVAVGGVMLVLVVGWVVMVRLVCQLLVHMVLLVLWVMLLVMVARREHLVVLLL